MVRIAIVEDEQEQADRLQSHIRRYGEEHQIGTQVTVCSNVITFLEQYKIVLRPGAQIHFKTDNAGLFAWSLEEFARYGYPVSNVTDDLHKGGVVGVMTGYEEKFYALGTPIHRCEIVMPNGKPEAGPAPANELT